MTNQVFIEQSRGVFSQEKWFIYRMIKPLGSTAEYLLDNGLWSTSTRPHGYYAFFSGYYRTKEDAIATCMKYGYTYEVQGEENDDA